MVNPYISTDTVTARKRSCFILFEKSDFQTIVNLLLVIHAIVQGVWTSLSVDEILLPMYMCWSSYFRGFPLKVK